MRSSTLAALTRLAALAFLAAMAGCEKRFPTAVVSGVVTLDGRPLAGARVAFEPLASSDEWLAGPGSYATTDSRGGFTLATLHGEPGAVVGPHRVSISTAMTPPRGASGEDAEAVDEKVPERYRDGTTPLEFTVPPGGTSSADFSLKSR